MHNKLINKIIENNNAEEMRYLQKLLSELISDLKYTNYSKYKEIEYNMYRQVYNNHICEELAKEWVSNMCNKDGSIGAKWSIDETNKYNQGYDKYDWYVVLNMMYSDYYNKDFTIDTYVELANDFMRDKDVENCKLLKYYIYVVK